jgi:hypothetical protein
MRLRRKATPPPNSSKVHRREGRLAFVQIKLVIFTLFFYSSAECSSPAAIRTRTRTNTNPNGTEAAAPRAADWAPRSSTCDKQLPRAAAWPPRSSIYMAPRSAATIKYHAQCFCFEPELPPCVHLKKIHQHTFFFASNAQKNIPV